MTSVSESHAFVDRFMAGVAKETARLGRPIRCAGSGCFWCCKEPVYTERREVVHMLEHVTDPAARAELTRKTAAWWDAFFERLKFADMPHPEEQVGSVTMMRYRAADLWCPLLVDGKCSLYAQRPMGCRYHAAIGSPKRCEDEDKRPKQRYVFSEQHAHVNASAVRMMVEDEPLPRLEFDHLGVWLGHLLLGKTERSRAALEIRTTNNPEQHESLHPSSHAVSTHGAR